MSSRLPAVRVVIDRERCRGCGACLLVCRAGCLFPADEPNGSGFFPVLYSGEGCLGDRRCLSACPEAGAISFRAAEAPAAGVSASARPAGPA